MRLIVYEIKKVFSQKFVRILLILIFLINALLCSYVALKDNNSIPQKYWQILMKMYRDDPKAVEEKYRILHDDLMKQIDAAVYAIQNEEPELPVIMKFDYINYKNFTDYDLFKAFIEYRDSVQNYSANVQSYINQAIRRQQDIEDFDNNINSFSYNYQNKIISKYSTLTDEITVEFDYVYGWDRLYEYEGSGLFGIIATLLIGCVIFSYDKTCGIFVIINTAKKGKYSTICAKIIAAIFLTLVISFILSLSSFIIIGVFQGYSNPLNAVQLLFDYLLCPFNVTFIGAYIISSLLRAIACMVFVLLVMLISIFLHKYALTIFGGTALIGVSYIVSIANTSNQYKYLNLLSISSTYDMLSRYRAVSIFTHAIDFFPILIFAVIIIGIVCIAGLIYILSSHKLVFFGTVSFFDKITQCAKNTKNKFLHLINPYKNTKNILPKYPKSFIVWEFSKYGVFVFIAIFLIMVKIYFISEEYAYKKSFNDDAYKEYMSYLSGAITDEKIEYINTEFDYITYICDIIGEMSNKYISEKITFDEYEAYVDEYEYAYARKDVILQVKEQANYLVEIQEKYGIDACFVYDTGILKIINRNFDIIIYIIIVLFTGGIYIREYNNDGSSLYFSDLLRTTKNGRNKTFRTKSIVATCIALGTYTGINIIDFVVIFNKYMIPNLNIPLISIKDYENIASDISIIEYLILTMLISLFAVEILSIISISLSQLLKKPIPVYFTLVLFTVVPHVLTNLGITICKYIDFTHLMASDTLIKLSLDTNVFGKYGYITIFIIIIFSIGMTLYGLSHRNYCVK